MSRWIQTVIIASVFMMLWTAWAETDSERPAQQARDTEATLDLLGSAVFEQQSEKLHRVFNTNKFVGRVLEHLRFDDAFESELQQVLLDAMPDMLTSLINALQDCRLTLTRLREGSEQADAILRCDLERTLQFYEFQFEKNAQGQFEIVDWFNYDAAALRSMTVAQLTAAGSGDVHTLNRLMGIRSQIKYNRLVLQLLEFDPVTSSYQAFEQIYQQLPANVRYSRALMVYRSSMAYSSERDGDYKQALKELDEHYGHDPRFAFALIDHHFHEKNYVSLHRTLDRYLAEFEGDAGLLTLKSAIYLDQGEIEAAIEHAELSTKVEPFYPDAYMMLMSIYMQQRRHAETLSVVQRMEQRFEVEYTAADFADESPESQAFVASSEFSNYLKTRTKNKSIVSP